MCNFSFSIPENICSWNEHLYKINALLYDRNIPIRVNETNRDINSQVSFCEHTKDGETVMTLGKSIMNIDSSRDKYKRYWAEVVRNGCDSAIFVTDEIITVILEGFLIDIERCVDFKKSDKQLQNGFNFLN